MSYSFSVRTKDKSSAIVAVHEELTRVVAAQPIHAKDSTEAAQAAEAMIGVLVNDDTQDVLVSVSGYLTWIDSTDGERIYSANVSVSASLSKRVSVE